MKPWKKRQVFELDWGMLQQQWLAEVVAEFAGLGLGGGEEVSFGLGVVWLPPEPPLSVLNGSHGLCKRL